VEVFYGYITIVFEKTKALANEKILKRKQTNNSRKVIIKMLLQTAGIWYY